MKTLHTLLLLGLIAGSAACGGYNSNNATTTPPTAGVMPAITALAPDSATSGSAGLTLTVNGSNFSAKSVINWNGAAQVTTWVSANQVTAVIAATDLASPATVPITVTNPAVAGTGLYGGGGTTAETSNSMDFTIN
jgi:IPT/TIG domain-containing protein